MTFGKHKNRTYKEIHDELPTYAMWVVTTSEEEDEVSAELLHLAKYLKERQYAVSYRPKPPGYSDDPAQNPIPNSDDEDMFPEEWEDDLL